MCSACVVSSVCSLLLFVACGDTATTADDRLQALAASEDANPFTITDYTGCVESEANGYVTRRVHHGTDSVGIERTLQVGWLSDGRLGTVDLTKHDWDQKTTVRYRFALGLGVRTVSSEGAGRLTVQLYDTHLPALGHALGAAPCE